MSEESHHRADRGRALVNGVLLGGIYALMTCGLNLIFGVVRVINFAHGEFLAFGALTAVTLVMTWGVPFLLALVLVALALGLFGYLMQAALIERVVDGPPSVTAAHLQRLATTRCASS